MTPSLIAFHNHAIAAFDALRLFVVSASRTDTIFSSRVSGAGQERREIIKFTAFQANGEIIRSNEGIELTIMPKFNMTNSFATRRLVIPRSGYASSSIMLASEEDFQKNGGRVYANSIASIAANNLPKSRYTTFDHDGMHFLVIADGECGTEPQDKCWRLAQAVNLTMTNKACLLRYPSLDTPGLVATVDDAGTIMAAEASLGSSMPSLLEAVQKLPNVLQFDLVDESYPPKYSISPLAFTLAPNTNRTLAAALGIVAEAQTKAAASEPKQRYRTILQISVENSQAYSQENLRQALGGLCADWEKVFGPSAELEVLTCTPLPIKAEDIQQTYEIILLAEPEDIRSYNDLGSFTVSLVPN